MCDIVVSLCSFLIEYCPDKYKTQWMRDEAVDESPAALKLITDWFVTSKIIKKLYTALHAENGLVFLIKVLIMSHFVVMKWVFLV